MQSIDKEPHLYPVILSGGSGSRLWPLSRTESPKQFIDLIGDKNLLQNTCLRIKDFTAQAPIVVCNDGHRFQVLDSFKKIACNHSGIILEPYAKNTAPAVALAAFEIMEQSEEALMLVLPADHFMQSTSSLHEVINRGIGWATQGYLITFGITPDFACTGFGYIKEGEKLEEGIFIADQFVEKPDLQTAKTYLKKGGYHWNSGMFLMQAKTYLKELEAHQPEMYKLLQAAYANKRKDLEFTRVDEEIFSEITDKSIDYAVMEKSKKVAVLPLADSGWSDIGTWEALYALGDKDDRGNIVNGDVYAIDASNCYLRSKDRMLAVAGVKDLIIVETADAILIADRKKTQDVKLLTSQLKKDKRPELEKHKRRYAPWGYIEEINHGEGFIISRLKFNVGGSRSTFMHHHRSVNFVVLSGAAEITIDGEKSLYSTGASVMIPALHTYLVKNAGKIPLELLEIQSGEYLLEDDIVKVSAKTETNETITFLN